MNYTVMFAEKHTGAIRKSICESHLNFQTCMHVMQIANKYTY